MIDVESTITIIEWGWAGAALEGTSGDLHVVVPYEGGALVSLLDGLGHGPEAAAASDAAVPVLHQHATEPVADILRRCHAALRKTRGVAMSVASIHGARSTMTWAGVGNVEGVLLRADGAHGRSDDALFVRPGVVGGHLPPLRSTETPLVPGDILIMVTDGVRSGFTTALPRHGPPQEIAESILARFARGSDDAHVLVARYLG